MIAVVITVINLVDASLIVYVSCNHCPTVVVFKELERRTVIKITKPPLLCFKTLVSGFDKRAVS